MKSFVEELPDTLTHSTCQNVRPELDSYTQTNLVSAIWGPDYVYDAHNALSDVSSLKSTFKNHYTFLNL